ncbi:hypothetical protein K8B33_02260 [Alcanivorax sp. JB21]|uniref:hypothetical protein n=1 Tax=Alcanivorax limicola TaxID=2874102 RepID=UPI001CC111D3|nr:hypothetical protein [Alcanivorax limicola]MBZ2187908.1 hypothetical protein [Alcanivorax limicola]
MSRPSSPPIAAFSRRHEQALARIGDVLIPGDDTLPSYSESGAAALAPRALAGARPVDQVMMMRLITVVGALPRPLIALMLLLIRAGLRLPGLVGAPARLLDLALKGVIMNTYYCGLDRTAPDGSSAVFQALDFRLQMHVDDEDAR